jgi:DNA-binding transcriptional MerR regulator
VLTELAALTGLSPTTIRYYVQTGLIRAGEFRGTLTRYPRRELLRLLGIQRVKSEGKVPLAEIQRRLDAQSEQDLEKWLSERPLSPALVAALGLARAPASSTPNSPAPPLHDDPLLGDPLLRDPWVETWQRITLLPGLDLMLRADAPAAARSAARRICQELRTATS